MTPQALDRLAWLILACAGAFPLVWMLGEPVRPSLMLAWFPHILAVVWAIRRLP